MLREFKAGEVVTASKLNARGSTTVVKTTPQSLASTTTLVNDNQLFVAVEANAVYEVHLELAYYGATAADLKVAWTVPSGSGSGSRHAIGPATSDTSFIDTAARTSRANWSTELTYGSDIASSTFRGALIEEGILTTGANAGTLQLQWAQVTSSATLTWVADGSITIRRLDVNA